MAAWLLRDRKRHLGFETSAMRPNIKQLGRLCRLQEHPVNPSIKRQIRLGELANDQREGNEKYRIASFATPSFTFYPLIDRK